MTEIEALSLRLRRPRRVTLLAFAALLLSAWNGLRLGEAVAFRQVLREYGAQPGPVFLAVSGGVWLAAGLAIAFGLWRGKAWAWYAAVGAAAGYPVWVWFERLIFQQPHANWPFALGVTLVCLAPVIVILFSRKTTSFFNVQRKRNERQ
ncbi:MAG: hypothetical protein FD146_2028 [Anaerolineaceae bacterium]|nr:MAG: hypothetical protein FD146_2028 [Anaerolineaceae bacterium]